MVVSLLLALAVGVAALLWLIGGLLDTWRLLKRQFGGEQEQVQRTQEAPSSQQSSEQPAAPQIDLGEVLREVIALTRDNAADGWELLPDKTAEPLVAHKEGTYRLRISGLGAPAGTSVELKAAAAPNQHWRSRLYYRGLKGKEKEFWYGTTRVELTEAGAVYVRQTKLHGIKAEPFEPAAIIATLIGERERRHSARLAWENTISPPRGAYRDVSLGVIPFQMKGLRVPSTVLVHFCPHADPKTQMVDAPEFPPLLLQRSPPQLQVIACDRSGRALLDSQNREVNYDCNCTEEVTTLFSTWILDHFRTQHGVVPEYGTVRIRAPFPVTCHAALIIGEERRHGMP